MPSRIGPKKPLRLFIREWREARGLTQQQLADRMETYKANVSNWENGKRAVGSDAQGAIAEALGIEPGDLFRHPDTPSADELLRSASPELRSQAIALIETLLKTARR